MLIALLILLGSAALIFFSCEYFVNAIEWQGKRFNIAKSAVGSILAAFGTALPESIVTMTGVIFGVTPEQKSIGVGSALGGPLVLSTIAYAVIGLTIYLFRRQRQQGTSLQINGAKLARDQLWFIVIFAVSLLIGIFPLGGKHWIGFLFFAAYGVYFLKEMRADDVGEEEDEEELEPLKLRFKDAEPATAWIFLQTALSLFFIFIGSHYFVHELEEISLIMGIPPHIVALLLSPIATELPEIVNILIWVRQDKETLALGNISGAMMIQTTIPSGLGMIFTPWHFDKFLLYGAIATLLSVIYLRMTLRSNYLSPERLVFAALFYVLFAVVVAFQYGI